MAIHASIKVTKLEDWVVWVPPDLGEYVDVRALNLKCDRSMRGSDNATMRKSDLGGLIVKNWTHAQIRERNDFAGRKRAVGGHRGDHAPLEVLDQYNVHGFTGGNQGSEVVDLLGRL